MQIVKKKNTDINIDMYNFNKICKDDIQETLI